MKHHCIKKLTAFTLSLSVAAGLIVTPTSAANPETVVDATAPYSGKTLVAINTDYAIGKISDSDTWDSLVANAETTGAVSFSEDLSVPDADMNFLIDTMDTVGLMDFDENGLGIIDPSSILPELTPEEIEYFSTLEENKEPLATVSETATTLTARAYTTSTYTTATFELVYEGEYCSIWNLQDGDERFLLGVDEAKAMADQYDTEYYQDVVDYFGDPLDADHNNDGKTAFLCYDLYGDADTITSSYTAGYFWSSNVWYNSLDCVHVDSAHGMGYTSSTVDYTPDYTKCMKTLIHELQHLICYDILGSTTNYPTFLNEGFSDACSHLVVGPSSLYSRLNYFNLLNYNASSLTGGKIALTAWNSQISTLPNYCYAYLFGQYIRSQSSYGDRIYQVYLNDVKDNDTGFSQWDYVEYLADMLEFEDAEEMINSFYIALANPTGSGVYSFNNLDFYMTPSVPKVSGEQTIIQGGVAYFTQTGDFSPVDAGDNIIFYSVSQDMELEEIAVTTGESAKTTYTTGDTLDVTDLSLTITYSNGATQTIAVTEDMISGFDSTIAVEELTLTVTYEGLTTTFTVTVEKPYAPEEPYVQIGTDQEHQDYSNGYHLILAFTNDPDVGFYYDGNAMYDVSASGYTSDDGYYYEYAFAWLAGGTSTEADSDLVASIAEETTFVDPLVTVGERSEDHTVLAYDGNVNSSAATDLRDAVIVMAVYVGVESYFTNYPEIVLLCDLNNDGVVNTEDCACVFAAYLD